MTSNLGRNTRWFALCLWAISNLFILQSVSVSQAQPQSEAPPAAVLIDKKPHATEAENLKFYRDQEKVIKGPFPLQRVLMADPAVLAAVPPGGKDDPVAWLQKNLQVDIDAKKHQIRVSLPKGAKDWQKAAVAAIALECVRWQFPNDTEAANIVKHIDTYQRLLGYAQKEKVELIKTSGPKTKLDMCEQDIERYQKKINKLVAELSPQQRLFVLKP